MNNTVLTLVFVKLLIVYFFIHIIGNFIPIFRIVTGVGSIPLIFWSSVFKKVYCGSIDLNKLPFIGCIFVLSDYIVLKILEKS